jgi:hypothetical protein
MAKITSLDWVEVAVGVGVGVFVTVEVCVGVLVHPAFGVVQSVGTYGGLEATR